MQVGASFKVVPTSRTPPPLPAKKTLPSNSMLPRKPGIHLNPGKDYS
jgi:hypothetical protein